MLSSMHGTLKLIYGESGKHRAEAVRDQINDIVLHGDPWVPKDDIVVEKRLKGLARVVEGGEIPLIPAERIDFGDGEFKVSIGNDVSLRDSDVFYFIDTHHGGTSTNDPNLDALALLYILEKNYPEDNRFPSLISHLERNNDHKVSSRVLESLLGIDTIKGSKANRVTLVSPLMPYSRQERRIGHEPQSARSLARLYETQGADSIMVMDLHADATTGFGNSLGFEHLRMSSLFIPYIRDNIGEGEEIIICAPDAGAGKAAGHYTKALNSPIINGHKRRDTSGVNVIETYELSDVNCEGRHAIIVDDLVATGGTMLRAAKKLHEERGAKSVYAFATHPVMPGKAFSNFSRAYEEGYFHGLVVGDTVYRGDLSGKYNWLTTIDTSRLFGNAILQKHIGGSVELRDYKN